MRELVAGQEGHCLLVVLWRLAGEAADDVGSELKVGDERRKDIAHLMELKKREKKNSQRHGQKLDMWKERGRIL